MATPFPLRGRRALPVLERLSPPASPQQAAPGLPTKRLKFLLGTEDNQGAMTIEAYLYRTDEYRSTTASISFPLPLIAGENPEALNERLEYDRKLNTEVHNILARHQVIVQRIIFQHLSKAGYPRRGSKPIPTLRIYSAHPDNAAGAPMVTHQESLSSRH